MFGQSFVRAWYKQFVKNKGKKIVDNNGEATHML